MLWFNGAGFSQDHRFARMIGQYLFNSRGTNDIHWSMTHFHFCSNVKVAMDLCNFISRQKHHFFIYGSYPIIVKASQALHYHVFRKSAFYFTKHLFVPIKENVVFRTLHRIHLVPQFPAKEQSVAAITLMIKINLVQEELPALGRRQVLTYAVERASGGS